MHDAEIAAARTRRQHAQDSLMGHYIDVAWGHFARNLSLALERLRTGEYLIISVPGETQYVQFAAGEDGAMRMEATSNGYVTNPLRFLDEDDFRHMQRLGWIPPTMTPEELERGVPARTGSSNFFADFTVPGETVAATLRATATLRYVFRVPLPDMLQYNAFKREGGPVAMPVLSLPRE